MSLGKNTHFTISFYKNIKTFDAFRQIETHVYFKYNVFQYVVAMARFFRMQSIVKMMLNAHSFIRIVFMVYFYQMNHVKILILQK